MGTNGMSYEKERETGVRAVLDACRLCVDVQAGLVSQETLAKKDRSPVTVADYGAQAIIIDHILEEFPSDPIVAEEDASALHNPENRAVLDNIVSFTRKVRPELDEERILTAIDSGHYGGGRKGRHWVLDPIDGTKGFLRRDQYAVALALIEDGEVVLGILGCPNLPIDLENSDMGRGCIFIAAKGEGAVQRSIESGDESSIHTDTLFDLRAVRICESMESGHSSHQDSSKISDLLGIRREPYRLDSQCKYAAVARGDVSAYLRLPTRPGYEEKIWDHAAGCIVVTEAGGTVTDLGGKPLDFSIGRTLKGNRGVIVTNGRIHEHVLQACRAVVG
jgi:3'(2'), 5'-bisphosphate nucleotidase